MSILLSVRGKAIHQLHILAALFPLESLFFNDPLGNYPQALRFFEQALQISRELKDRAGEGSVLNNLSNVYRALGNYPQALHFYEQALQLQREIGVPTQQVEGNIGDVYLAQGRLKEAYEICKRLDYPIRLGRYYLRAGEYQRAREEFTRSLKVAAERRNAEFLLADYIGLGQALEGLKEYAEAKTAYQQAVEVIEQQRAGLTEAQRRTFFAATVQGFSRLEPYEGLVRVSSYLKDAPEGFFWAENTRARLLLEAVAHHSTENRPGLPEHLAGQETDLTNRLASTTKQQEIAFE